ncbi:MAG: hypothetical protein JOZ72_14925 [Alphaproteobacteria bacterium]|nr:hypothetical protein [Alphaproteobacteria bacterium]
METLRSLLSGAVAMASFTAALFFLRFWFGTRDRFFLLFAAAFAVYGACQLALGLAEGSDYEPLFYLPRLLTFGLIVLAVVGKNRSRAR